MVGGVPELLLQRGVEDDSGTVGVGPEILEKAEEGGAHAGVELTPEVRIDVALVGVEEQEVLEIEISPGRKRAIGRGGRGLGVGVKKS